jgi:RNA polymerase sigma-70 factor (ECF subfamily)
MDLCQSVLASFFVRVAAGDYELEQPQDLLKLLVVMTRNKLAYQARKHHARRRDNRRIAAGRVEELEMAAAGPSPSQIVAGQELLREFCRRLTTEERQLMDLRNQGRSWSEIAGQLGGTPEGRRKQLARGAERVQRELRLYED